MSVKPRSKNETTYTYSALEYSQLCTSASNSHDTFNCWGQSTKKRIKHSNLNVNDNRERWLLVYQSFVIWDSNKLYIIRINKKNNGRTLAHNPKNINARLWMFPHWRQRITRKRIGFCSRVTHGPKKWEDGKSNDIQSQSIGLVFIFPHRHDKPKQWTCLFYQSTKNHAKKTWSKSNRQPRNDSNTRGHLKKIVGVNSNKW